MKIENNCPNCGRLVQIDDETRNNFTCDLCECEINLEYDMIINSNNVETEVVIFKENK